MIDIMTILSKTGVLIMNQNNHSLESAFLKRRSEAEHQEQKVRRYESTLTVDVMTFDNLCEPWLKEMLMSELNVDKSSNGASNE